MEPIPLHPKLPLGITLATKLAKLPLATKLAALPLATTLATTPRQHVRATTQRSKWPVAHMHVHGASANLPRPAIEKQSHNGFLLRIRG